MRKARRSTTPTNRSERKVSGAARQRRGRARNNEVEGASSCGGPLVVFSSPSVIPANAGIQPFRRKAVPCGRLLPLLCPPPDRRGSVVRAGTGRPAPTSRGPTRHLVPDSPSRSCPNLSHLSEGAPNREETGPIPNPNRHTTHRPRHPRPPSVDPSPLTKLTRMARLGGFTHALGRRPRRAQARHLPQSTCTPGLLQDWQNSPRDPVKSPSGNGHREGLPH